MKKEILGVFGFFFLILVIPTTVFANEENHACMGQLEKNGDFVVYKRVEELSCTASLYKLLHEEEYDEYTLNRVQHHYDDVVDRDRPVLMGYLPPAYPQLNTADEADLYFARKRAGLEDHHHDPEEWQFTMNGKEVDLSVMEFRGKYNKAMGTIDISSGLQLPKPFFFRLGNSSFSHIIDPAIYEDGSNFRARSYRYVKIGGYPIDITARNVSVRNIQLDWIIPIIFTTGFNIVSSEEQNQYKSVNFEVNFAFGFMGLWMRGEIDAKAKVDVFGIRIPKNFRYRDLDVPRRMVETSFGIESVYTEKNYLDGYIISIGGFFRLIQERSSYEDQQYQAGLLVHYSPLTVPAAHYEDDKRELYAENRRIRRGEAGTAEKIAERSRERARKRRDRHRKKQKTSLFQMLR